MPEGARSSDARSTAPASWPLAVLFLAGAAIFALYYLGVLRGRPVLWTDSYEYALAGRALAEGRGLTTDSATVMEFWLLYNGALPLPYFFHDVGNSLLHALTYRVFGSSDIVIPMASGLCFALLGPAAFVLGRRLFGARVGGLAAVLVLTNTQLLAFSTTGLSEVPTALGLTVLLLLLVPSARSGALERVMIGAVFGGLVVLRSNAIVFFPWICVFLWTLPGTEERNGSRRSTLARSRPLALFLAGFCVIWGPMAIRTGIALGRPLSTVASYYITVFHTSALPPGPVKDVYSSPGLDVHPIAFFAEHPGELISKARWQLGRLVPDLLRGGGLWVKNDWAESVVLFLFVLGALAPPAAETATQRRARLLLLAFVGTSLVVGLAVFIRWRHLYLFLPAVLIYDAEVILRVFGRDQNRQAMGAGALARLALIAVLLAALGWSRLAGDVWGEFGLSTRASNDYYQALGEFLRKNTRRDAVVLVRCPNPLIELRALGWYGRRQMVEQSPYTDAIVLARKAPGRIFFLATSGRGEGRPVDGGIPGFVPLARWDSGSGDHARLFVAPR